METGTFILTATFGAVLLGVGVLVGFLLGDHGGTPNLSPPPRFPELPRPILSHDGKIDPRHQDPAI